LVKKNSKDELRTTTFIWSRYYTRNEGNRRFDLSRASRKSRLRRTETSSDTPAVSKITPKIGHSTCPAIHSPGILFLLREAHTPKTTSSVNNS